MSYSEEEQAAFDFGVQERNEINDSQVGYLLSDTHWDHCAHTEAENDAHEKGINS